MKKMKKNHDKERKRYLKSRHNEDFAKRRLKNK